LENLEFGLFHESDQLDEEMNGPYSPILEPVLEQDIQLPILPPPSTYYECVIQLRALDKKADTTFSSPTRARYHIVVEAIEKYLGLADLDRMDLENIQKGQIEVHKAKLKKRKSLQKRSQLLAGPTLQKLKDDQVKDAEKILQKAINARDSYEKKANKAFHRYSINTRTAERERLKWLAENQYILGTIDPIVLETK
jgi:hypothetical protein